MAENEKLDKTPAAPEKKDKVEKKPEKSRKPGLIARVKQWAKETRAELKKVQWPTWKQTLNNTLIVIVVCLVVGLAIFLFDKLADGLLSALIGLFKG